MDTRLTQDFYSWHTSDMTYIIAGLGNPGEEYTHTRHNTGEMFLRTLAEDDFSFEKKIHGEISHIKVGKEKVTLVFPHTFMNNSGKTLASMIKSVKAAEKLIVIYDDFNLPLGKIRISFDRSSGGHNGLESIIKSLKTQAFIRIRIGVAPQNSEGGAKVPHGNDKIEKFILGSFKDAEVKELKKISKILPEIITTIIKEGKEKAMSVYNAG